MLEPKIDLIWHAHTNIGHLESKSTLLGCLEPEAHVLGLLGLEPKSRGSISRATETDWLLLGHESGACGSEIVGHWLLESWGLDLDLLKAWLLGWHHWLHRLESKGLLGPHSIGVEHLGAPEHHLRGRRQQSGTGLEQTSEWVLVHLWLLMASCILPCQLFE